MTLALTPLNVTVLVPWVVPKLLPLIDTLVPVGPVEGVSEEINGGGDTTTRES